MTEDSSFETSFIATLNSAAEWIASTPRHKYKEFGDDPFADAFFMLQRTMLPGALLNRDDVKIAKGIHLKQISVPKAQQRKRYASRIVDRLLKEAKAAEMAYVFVESVVTSEMHELMKRRSEFRVAPHFRDCYIAVLLK